MSCRGRASLRLLTVIIVSVIALSGCHRSPTDHSVTLTWQPPTPRAGVTVVGYNIYRHTSEGSEVVKIADGVSGPPYEDRLVNSGRTYFYALTSVDQLGRESTLSAEIKVEVP